MRTRVQVIVEADDDTPAAVHEVAELERSDLHIDTLGLHLAEALVPPPSSHLRHQVSPHAA
jgi:hypothetical protein